MKKISSKMIIFSSVQHTPVSGDGFGPGISNVRSGSYSAHAQVRGTPLEVLLLSQTLTVLPNQQVDLGFYVGHGQGAAIGINSGSLPGARTKILVDGTALSLNDGDIPGGGSSADFLEVHGSFNTGEKTEIQLTFQLDGSGFTYAVNSFDDFYAITEPAIVKPDWDTVPDLPSGGLLASVGFAVLGFLRMFVLPRHQKRS